MKNLITSFLLLLTTATIAEAQIAAGKMMFGGNANYTSAASTWFVNPSVGYFITDDIALGSNLGLGHADGGFFIDWGIAGRKYFSIHDNTYLYGHASLGFGIAGGGSLRVNAYPGVMYFFNERLAIDGALNGLGGGGIGLSLIF